MSDEYHFDAAAADAACAFIEQNCCFTDDKWAGKPFLLEPWQRDDIVRPMFGWKRADGTRQYRRVIVWIARKNGKTELAAAISHVALIATGVVGGQVYSIAKDKNQASIVFDKAARMVSFSPTLSDVVEPLKTALFVPKLGSSFKPMSGKPDGKHGYSASGLIGDEVHEWPDDRLYTFLHQSSAAREQPIEFLISTAGEMHGYGWELWQECQSILDGTIDDPETLVVIYAPDRDDEWTDPETWQKANPNLGVSVRLDYLESECRRAQLNPRLENDFKRYHLNMWTEQAIRWLPMDLWKLCSEDPSNLDLWRELPERLLGRRCYGAIDLASTTDIAARVLAFPPDDDGEPWVYLPKFYVPEVAISRRSQRDKVPYDQWVKMGALTATPGNVIDYAFIKADCYEDCERYQVAKFAFDRWNATQLMIEMMDDGVPVEKFGQGFASMSAPAKELERQITGQLMEHGNHPVLTWMARNAACKTDPAGNVKPDKEKAREKIDGIVAQCMAIGVAIADEDDHSPSVYEERGILTV